MIKRFIVLILFAGLFLCASCAENGLVLSEIPEDSQIDLNNTNASDENASFSDANEKKKAGCVYICGAVETPGIYEFYEGARLDEEADADAVNLAMEVKDAQQIRIPYIGETKASDEEKLIDLNTASTADLCTIPGIGESRATAIIEYREKNGGFSDIEELKNISGIKDATFEKIKPYVCVR